MNCRSARWLLTATFLSLVAMHAAGTRVRAAQVSPPRPNVILILVDDLGWTDLSCQGSAFYETPNIDRLAKEGMRFTQAYAACTVCSPTRGAVLTGKYPTRLHITDWIPGHLRPFAKLKVPDWTMHLPQEEMTLAEVLKKAGYATAHVGKWHLGNEEFWPQAQGFDLNIGGNHRGQPPSYFFPYERNGIKLPGLEKGKEGEYLTDRLTDAAIKFIEANRDRPFFLYLPHYAVHTPLQAKAEKIAKYRDKPHSDQPHGNVTYAGMIESLDESIGRIAAKLDELKLTEKTVVIFTSDNGGLTLNQVTSNVPLRAGKGSAYEGGVRVPLIVRYPPLVGPCSECDVPAMSIDLLPTIAELCGVREVPAMDGVSLAPVLKDSSAKIDRQALYWHYPHYHPGGATPYGAIRDGDWRLIEFYENGKVELYNLRDDIGEKNDLAREMPDKRLELLEKLRKWRTSVGGQMPTENSAYDPARSSNPAGGKGKAKAKAATPKNNR